MGFDTHHAGNAEFAGVDNAGVDISARCGKGGHCGSGQCRSGQWVVIIGYFNNRFMDFNGLFVAALMGNLNTLAYTPTVLKVVCLGAYTPLQEDIYEKS